MAGYPGHYPGQRPFSHKPSAYSFEGRRHEFIVSSLMHGKVLDVSGANPSPGAHLIMWPRKTPIERNQLWYLDETGVIRSSLNDFAIDAKPGTHATLEPFNGGRTQQWILNGNQITNRSTNECLDVFGENRRDGARVGSYHYKGSSNQHWNISYVN